MGAFIDTVTVLATPADTDETLTKWFEERCADAAWQHGHGGYTGSLAEKEGLGLVVDWREPIPETGLDDYQESDPVFYDKWGPARAVRFVNSEGAVYWMMGGYCSE